MNYPQVELNPEHRVAQDLPARQPLLPRWFKGLLAAGLPFGVTFQQYGLLLALIVAGVVGLVFLSVAILYSRIRQRV